MDKPIRLEKLHSNAHGHAYYRYKCHCGNEFIALRNKVSSGETSSCGCYRKERARKLNLTHGCSIKDNLKLWKIWNGMMDRCYNTAAKQYKNYGGRGISVCNEWHDVKLFLKWLEESNYQDGLTIERIDVNGNYCPENCTWIPRNQQSYNTTKSLGVQAARDIRSKHLNGKAVTDLAVEYSVVKTTIYRIVSGKAYKNAS